MKAWLITWEWIGNHAAKKEKVVAVLPPRWHSNKVMETVEMLYVNSLHPEDKLSWVKHPKDFPYKAKLGQLKTKSGDSCVWEGQMTCGHNPSLLARKVENIKPDGGKSFTWDELSRPVPNW